jgi:hypothetical protein
MLERLRGQRLVFVGDSLGRNQWESMLCMLAEGVQNKSRIYEINGETISKHVGELIFRFQDYNCTVEYYRDPFLVPQTRPPPASPRNVTSSLKLDQVSWSAGRWPQATGGRGKRLGAGKMQLYTQFAFTCVSYRKVGKWS